ncbi:TPA: AI-2E family transporter [Clostridioides difficile]|nr:AI-2E family transporter [Clostridioides difficile]HBF8742380.1 AI-2E family transporter [Clostridioides difficile]HBG0165731.1 AI-2E family transporter [Clostridioides difficile]HBG0611342.1 AI-2E family transporter [Clostridioides difficile]HBG0614152.1 AI-2E family transporter [Clostridioides difficile]
MKINWNTKYTTIAIYTFIIAASSIIFYLVSSQIDVFSNNLDAMFTTLQPFIIGFAIAYLLNFILKFYEDRIFIKSEKLKKLKQSSKRGLGLLLTYATAMLILYLFMYFVLPQVIESIVGLANDIPMYVNNATKLIDKLMTDLNLDEQYFNLAVDKWNEFVTYIIKFVTDLIPILGSMLKNVASSIWNIVLGLIVSVYLLIDKEKFYGLSKKITYAVFTEKQAARILELTHRSNYTFGRFLGWKILDSFIIGILTFVILTLVKMPYTLLISVIIGITNIIPFFGPLFGAIPSTLIVLFVSPIKAFWLLLIILIIQQIDGNIIGPKILGDSIGISAFWILFSLLVAGKLLGFIGMVIGVPMFAVIYSIIKDIVEGKLDKKGLPTDTSDYM